MSELYDENGMYIGPESEYNDNGIDTRTGLPWPGSEQTESKSVESVVSSLTEDEKQLLKDTIQYGCWGDCQVAFTDNDEGWAMGYCTNDAKRGGHFQGRQISSMFRSIYKKLCPNNGVGDIISHCSDWWGDGTGDMLFIREDWYEAFEEWAGLRVNPIIR